MARFFHYTLRTTDVAAARAFYDAVLGVSGADIVPLHEQALARGARPHWLGFIEVDAVEAAAAAFTALGASPLGPKWTNPQGLKAVVTRDPESALLALAKAPPQAKLPHPEVIWHQLSTRDVERVKASYAELLGWEFKPPFELAGVGPLHPFAWAPGGPVVGSFSDIAERPAVHPHWLFHFRVARLEPALQAVRAGGGLALPALTLANGDRVAACDDGQGAAFALFEQRA
jgi:predicted enzyme related to lactoylglutathione lyase